MKNSALLQGLAAVCFVATTATVSAQNAIQLFGQPANVRLSTQGTTRTNQNVFNSTILNLTCPSSIVAKISSSADGTGNVLVDNFITFGTGEYATDICVNGTSENGDQQNCFTSSYGSAASGGGLIGQDPDNFVATGGVPPIDVHHLLQPGAVQAQIGLVDTGGYLTSSTLYLVTNCTSSGVSGPGQVTGNPIPSSNPTTTQLSQGFSFNANTNQQVQFGYDLSEAQTAGTPPPVTLPSIPQPSPPRTLRAPRSRRRIAFCTPANLLTAHQRASSTRSPARSAATPTRQGPCARRPSSVTSFFRMLLTVPALPFQTLPAATA
jgi:hypothetical protein